MVKDTFERVFDLVQRSTSNLLLQLGSELNQICACKVGQNKVPGLAHDSEIVFSCIVRYGSRVIWWEADKNALGRGSWACRLQKVGVVDVVR